MLQKSVGVCSYTILTNYTSEQTNGVDFTIFYNFFDICGHLSLHLKKM